jgi:6-phosphofructokinase 1
LNEELIDTSGESGETISQLRHTPSGAFGSCRLKLSDPDKDRKDFDRLLAVFKAHDIGYFFYNGGGDSADTCFKVARMSELMGYPVQAVHVPKTIDNDLPITDNCPGFGSVAKYVAISTLEASLDVRAMSRTSTRIFVFEVMGRHAGWIAAAGGLATDYGLPVVILFPEIPFDEKAFLSKVDANVKQFGFCSIVVSEGCRYPDGTFISEQGAKDAFGHTHLGGAAPIIAHLIRSRLGHPFHWAVANYLQRAARHIASAVDVKQAYELGCAAVNLALAGRNSVMPTIERTADTPYAYRIGTAELKDVANVEKMMPHSFISEDGYGITDACRRYLLPLIQGEDYPPYTDGMPAYVTLKNALTAKKLPPFTR